MVTWGKVDLSKDQRAERLAKIALGWDGLSVEEKMDKTTELIQRAQQIKETL